ncbi:MAG: MFS transporter [Limisphaerales bacterium]
MSSRFRAVEYGELAGLFFLQSLAAGTWLVTLTSVLEANGLAAIRSYAYATTAVAAFISPLLFGAMADRHASPVRVLRWLASGSAVAACVASWAIERRWSAPAVLLVIQMQALFYSPTGSIASTIAFSRLRNSQREFGPVRAAATVGWMVGCWVVSALSADRSTEAGYVTAVVWIGLAAFTWFLPSVTPPASTGRHTLRELLGWDALALLKNPDHRVVFITVALYSIPLAAFYPFTPLHLKALGFQHTASWMSLGQVTEVMSLFALGVLLDRWRLKWIFAAGLAFGVLRFLLCAINGPFWLVAGVFLHGASFTLFYITGQIYLNERVEESWRARAQGLMWLMNYGVGNLAGYLGTGSWFAACARVGGIEWSLFWAGLALACGLVMGHFLATYRGQRRVNEN